MRVAGIDGGSQTDLYYPDARLAIEYDGATHRESLAADNRRQNRLINAGYRLLRFTAGHVFDAPAEVVSMIRRALASPTTSLGVARAGPVRELGHTSVNLAQGS